jgi:chromosome segregation ATPase
MNKKITTIDDLAVMIEKESSANEKRFGTLEDGLTELKSEFAEIKENMATKQDLHRVEARILSAIGDIATEVKNHDRRILALEKIVKT